jgi:hypothetical protein
LRNYQERSAKNKKNSVPEHHASKKPEGRRGSPRNEAGTKWVKVKSKRPKNSEIATVDGIPTLVIDCCRRSNMSFGAQGEWVDEKHKSEP